MSRTRHPANEHLIESLLNLAEEVLQLDEQGVQVMSARTDGEESHLVVATPSTAVWPRVRSVFRRFGARTQPI